MPPLKICVLVGLLLTEYPDLTIVRVDRCGFMWTGERHKEGYDYLRRRGYWLANKLLEDVRNAEKDRTPT